MIAASILVMSANALTMDFGKTCRMGQHCEMMQSCCGPTCCEMMQTCYDGGLCCDMFYDACGDSCCPSGQCTSSKTCCPKNTFPADDDSCMPRTCKNLMTHSCDKEGDASETTIGHAHVWSKGPHGKSAICIECDDGSVPTFSCGKGQSNAQGTYCGTKLQAPLPTLRFSASAMPYDDGAFASHTPMLALMLALLASVAAVAVYRERSRRNKDLSVGLLADSQPERTYAAFYPPAHTAAEEDYALKPAADNAAQ